MMWEGVDEVAEEDEELELVEGLVMVREPRMVKEVRLAKEVESYSHILGNQSHCLFLWVLQYLSDSHKHCTMENFLHKCTEDNHL